MKKLEDINDWRMVNNEIIQEMEKKIFDKVKLEMGLSQELENEVDEAVFRAVRNA